MSGFNAFLDMRRGQYGRQARWSDSPISLRIFQFVVIHTVKCFDLVNKAEVDVFFWNSLAFSMIQQILTI